MTAPGKITDLTYTIDGTRYHVLVIDTGGNLVLAAPDFNWCHGGYARYMTKDLRSYIHRKLVEHDVSGNRTNLATCLEAAYRAHLVGCGS